MSLSVEQFPDFYQAVHGHRPFPWQMRLARLAADGAWPPVLALPTSSGKTSVIDVAVFALALQSGRPREERTAPLRIFFIIDRRIVVDEAAEHTRWLASELEKALEQPASVHPVLYEVAQNLSHYSSNRPLHVAVLRGGMYRDETWTRTPNVPTVCLSTVDQIGSRLLFRGYGLIEFQRPIHAGLIGSDALLIVDEAHLSNPFLETLQAVAHYQTWAEQQITRPWKFIQLSATPGNGASTFLLEDADYQNEELGRRLRASKQARLIEAQADNFETTVRNEAMKLAKSDGVQVVGVVVNRVASARKIFEQLKTAGEAILLTGRIRPFDRDRLLGKWLDGMRAGRNRKADPAGNLFVVATQTVEVGANLDFDALVTEAASLAALRQRFGRLDRLGELGQTQAAIALRKEPNKKDDPVYGEEITKTWNWLKSNAQKVGKQKIVDFGIDTFRATLENSKDEIPTAESEPAPILFPSHIDTWAQTSPTPHADPDPAPFLHGRNAFGAADVQIVWRADLDGIPPDRWAEVVALAPPVVREALPVPVWTARAWLSRARVVDIADVEGVMVESGETGESQLHALRWRGPEESEFISPDKIAPGDTLVVPASYGGADEYGWHPESQAPVEDIGDECANELAHEFATTSGFRMGRRPYRLRLDIGVSDRLETEDKMDEEGRKLSDEEMDNLLHSYLATINDKPEKTRFNAIAARKLLDSKKSRRAVYYPEGTRNAVVLSVKPTKPQPQPNENKLSAALESSSDHTDSDDTASAIGKKVPLQDHCRGVADWAKKFATDCGLSRNLI
ncbi:MAG TPA: type I-U CRISPR-associated helicase/endonuclease Cas3, partial [Blastocatellia bacterium]|nr:type I-U CRISPR-associated helicase/endonuclease Cas3 [Blastocatellia bacterium]